MVVVVREGWRLMRRMGGGVDLSGALAKMILTYGTSLDAVAGVIVRAGYGW